MRYNEHQQRLLDQKSGAEMDRRVAQFKKPPMCEGCSVNRSDPPSKLCVGCQAYREHQQ